MDRVVLDTNVLVSGMTTAGTASISPAVKIVQAWRNGDFILVVSEHILSELTRTFQDPYFQKYITPELAAGTVRLLRDEAIVTPLTVAVSGVASHSEDDRTLATALSGKASYLVTKDKAFLKKVGRIYRGVTLLTPVDFLAVLTHKEAA